MKFNAENFRKINNEYIDAMNEFVEPDESDDRSNIERLKVASDRKKVVEDYLHDVDSFDGVTLDGHLWFLDLDGVDFSGAKFEDIEFRSCNVRNSNFTRASFDYVNFSGDVITDDCAWQKATDEYRRWCNDNEPMPLQPDGNHVVNATFCDSNFAGAKFKSCTIQDTIFKGCLFTNFDVKHIGCTFEDCGVTTASFVVSRAETIADYKLPRFCHCFISDMTVRDRNCSDKYEEEIKIYNKNIFDDGCMVYFLNSSFSENNIKPTRHAEESFLYDNLADWQKFTAKLSPRVGEAMRSAVDLSPLLSDSTEERRKMFEEIGRFCKLPARYINKAAYRTNKTFADQCGELITTANAEKYVKMLKYYLKQVRNEYYEKHPEEKPHAECRVKSSGQVPSDAKPPNGAKGYVNNANRYHAKRKR